MNAESTSKPKPQRPLPPYGRHVEAVLRDPQQLARCSGCTATCATIWVATGPDAWHWPRHRPNHLAVVLPPGEDPEAFDWAFLQGHEPVLLIGEQAEDAQARRQIATAMMRDGIQRVLAGPLLMAAHETDTVPA